MTVQETPSDHPLFSIDGPLAVITFNRPEKANAWRPAQTKAMLDFLYDVEQRPDVRCVLIKANGKHFMAGGELDFAASDRLTLAQQTQELETAILEFARLVRVMQRLSKPVVASVQGGVIGAAVGLVAACDLSIAADNAFFSVAHINHGGSNDGLVSYFLPRHIGLRKTLELSLLGDRLSAAQAFDLGLINFVAPAAELAAATQKLVDRLCAGPTLGYGLIKDLAYASLGHSMEEQARMEAELYAGRAMHTEDVKDGLKAFFERRPPKFMGK